MKIWSCKLFCSHISSSEDLLSVTSKRMAMLFLMPMKVDIDCNDFFLYFRFSGAKAWPVFYNTFKKLMGMNLVSFLH